nr:hypothetical protein CFP56_32516 [Quercus suber]
MFEREHVPEPLRTNDIYHSNRSAIRILHFDPHRSTRYAYGTKVSITDDHASLMAEVKDLEARRTAPDVQIAQTKVHELMKQSFYTTILGCTISVDDGLVLGALDQHASPPFFLGHIVRSDRQDLIERLGTMAGRRLIIVHPGRLVLSGGGRGCFRRRSVVTLQPRIRRMSRPLRPTCSSHHHRDEFVWKFRVVLPARLMLGLSLEKAVWSMDSLMRATIGASTAGVCRSKTTR